MAYGALAGRFPGQPRSHGCTALPSRLPEETGGPRTPRRHQSFPSQLILDNPLNAGYQYSRFYRPVGKIAAFLPRAAAIRRRWIRFSGDAMTKTRETITDVAVGLFHQKGYFATSISDIARGSGIQKAGIYYYFKSKESLLFHIMMRTMDELMDHVARSLREGGGHRNPASGGGSRPCRVSPSPPKGELHRQQRAARIERRPLPGHREKARCLRGHFSGIDPAGAPSRNFCRPRTSKFSPMPF